MMSAKVADWCEVDAEAGVAFCGTRMVEHSRRSMDMRWCFRHRTRHEFWRVVMVPDGLSYYDPHVEVRGPQDDCVDLFPGWTREWGDDR